MALNLSTLTGATSGEVLAEALTTADFLEPCPVLRNLSRGSNKGGDAKQSVSLNQPRALPLIKNPAGNLGGYLYIPDVAGNYATGPSVTIGANQTWEAEVDVVITQFGNYIAPFGGGIWDTGFGFIIRSDGAYRAFSKGATTSYSDSNDPIIPFGSPTNIKYGFNGTLLYVDINGQRAVDSGGNQSSSITHPLHLNQQTLLTHQGNYAIQKAKLTVNSSVVFDCDFNGSTSIRHGDQKWKAAVGGVVSIAKPELITNGNFDTDTAWTKGTGWTIADGVATLDNTSGSGSTSLVSSVFSVTSGTEYKIVVDVISTSSGFRLYDAYGVLSYNLDAGRNVFYKEATSSSYSVTPLGLAGSSGSIDNISVTEVLPDSGRDPITVVKKDILRFDGADDFMNGLFNQTVTGGYMFASFSVLGDGGESYGHILDVTSTGQQSGGLGSFTFFRGPSSANNIRVKYNNNGSAIIHQDVFDSSLGDIMLEGKMEDGSQISKVNNANADNGTTTFSGVLNAEEFVIAADNFDGTNPALDLEFLALFPASITDAQADDVRNYINNRNNVFSLIDSQGYYFYNSQSAPVGAISSGSSAWNGRIVGSDNGDADKLATQATANDQPVSDGFKVTFADNSDHLDIPSTTQAGWQVVGTSLGTFAYRVNANAVTELNLLGNLGSTSYRQAGDLYGVILLPESATGKDIEEARKLLIDRGSLDGSLVSAYFANWVSRNDIVEFHSVDLSNATNVSSAWDNCSSLTTFPALNLSGATNISYSWVLCSSLNNFGAIDARNGTNFTGAWKDCSALTSFPADAKLGTEATNVNFNAAWQQSGLTSFSTPLPTATSVTSAWNNCSSLTSFSTELPLVTTVYDAWFNCASLESFSTELPLVTSVSYAWYNCSSLSDFRTTDIKNCSSFTSAWQNCSSLSSFPSDALLGTEANNVNFQSAWQDSGLTSFPADIDLSQGTNFFNTWRGTDLTSFETPITSATRLPQAWQSCGSLTNFSSAVFQNWNPSSLVTGVFNRTWKFCTSLTAQSVENILTSIDASNQHGTDNGTSTGNPLGDSGIDIDYNVATGSLSAATNAAVDSLKAKGWSIIVNNVTL